MAEAQALTLDVKGLTDTNATAALKALLDLVGGLRTTPEHPLITPALLLGNPALSPFAERMKPSTGFGLVHESQSFRRSGAATGENAAKISATLEEKNGVRLFSFSSVDSDGAMVGQMQTRLRDVPLEDMARFRGTPFRPGMDKGDMIWRHSLPLDRETVRRYVAMAGDDNPIHVSDRAAQAVGLSGAVVPGMLFCGLIEPVVLDARGGGDILDLKLRFMAPVPLGQTLRFGVQDKGTTATGTRKLRVFVVTEIDVIAAIADVDLAEAD